MGDGILENIGFCGLSSSVVRVRLLYAVDEYERTFRNSQR